MVNKKKKYNARFPPARIKKIMQKDEEVGKVAAPVPVIISRALELFVESLVLQASEITRSRNAKTLTTSHLKACILSDERLVFLNELVSAIPDVQGEEDVCEGNAAPSRPKIMRARKPRKISRNSAGPSHSTAEDTDSVDDEDDYDLEEETDEGSSENTSEIPSNQTYGAVMNASPFPQQNVVAPMQSFPRYPLKVDDDYDS
ncbi:dr1-associated corepressor-like [Ornithodoros turicata]